MQATIKFLDPPTYNEKTKKMGVMWGCKDTEDNRYLINQGFETQMSVGMTADFSVKPAPWNPNTTIINGFENGGAGQAAPAAPTGAAPVPSVAHNDKTPANIWIQGITQQAVNSGVHSPHEAFWWAVQNYTNFRDRKPMSPFPGTEQGSYAPPMEKSADVPSEPAPPPPSLDDHIPF